MVDVDNRNFCDEEEAYRFYTLGKIEGLSIAYELMQNAEKPEDVRNKLSILRQKIVEHEKEKQTYHAGGNTVSIDTKL